MSDCRISVLENNLNVQRSLNSSLQGKIARQRDDIIRKDERIATLMFDKKQITKALDDLRKGGRQDER